MEPGGGGRGGGWDEIDPHTHRAPPTTRSVTFAGDKPASARRLHAPLPRAESNRTLFDIIREEGGGPRDSRKSWRHFKEKLRRRGSGGGGSSSGRRAAWTSSVPVPTSDIPLHNNSRSASRRDSARVNPMHDPDDPDHDPDRDTRGPSLVRNPSRAIERSSGRFDGYNPMRRLQREDNYENDDDDESEGDEEEEEEEEGEGEEEERQPVVRMSLMSLLAETDEYDGGLAYMMEEEDEEEEGDGGGEYNNCCVCMVRHRGVAFVPCGHSFCRLCSREMWAERGNCPLCNNYILEILDIF